MEEDRQVESLTTNVLANLTVEELEQRLEMQLLQMPEGDLCIVNYCGVNGCAVLACDDKCEGYACGVHS